MSAEPSFVFRRPSTTGEAFRFGQASARHGHRRLDRLTFDAGATERHPYPTSLWRAYLKGYTLGKRQRIALEDHQPKEEIIHAQQDRALYRLRGEL